MRIEVGQKRRYKFAYSLGIVAALLFAFVQVALFASVAEFYAEFPRELERTIAKAREDVEIIDVHDGAIGDPNFVELSHPERFSWLLRHLECSLNTCVIYIYGQHNGAFVGGHFYQKAVAHIDYVGKPNLLAISALSIDESSIELDGRMVRGIAHLSIGVVLASSLVLLVFVLILVLALTQDEKIRI